MNDNKNSTPPQHPLNPLTKPGAKMKAIFIEKFGGTPIVMEIPIPTPGPDEVLIRVEAAPVNPLDLAYMRGAATKKPPLPCQLGYEGAGLVVVSGGGEMGNYLLGKKVMVCAPPGRPSTWSQYMIAKEMGCFPMGDSVSYDVGAAGIINPVTAVAFLDIAKEERHKAIVQTAAASQVGRMIVKLMKKEGIKTINIVRSAEQKKVLESIGGDVVLNSEEPGFEKELAKKAEELEATCCLECISGEVTHKIIKALPRGSITYVYGHLASDVLTGVDFSDLLVRNKTIKSFTFVRWLTAQGPQGLEVMQRIQDMLGDELKTDVAKVASLKEVKDAIAIYMGNMTKGKVLIKPHL